MIKRIDKPKVNIEKLSKEELKKLVVKIAKKLEIE